MADWQPGDLALRVHRVAPDRQARTGVRQGGIYTVSEVVYSETREVGLRLEGVNFLGRLRATRATGFVKVTPGADIEGIEAEKLLPSKVGQDA